MRPGIRWIIVAVVLSIVVAAGLYWRQSHAPAADGVTVGVLTDLSAYTSEYGRQELAGLQVLAEETPGGRAVRLAVQDTKGAAKDAVSALNQLYADPQPPQLLFSSLSSVSSAILPLADQKGVLTLCNATSDAPLQISRNSIRNFPSPKQEFDTLYDGAITPLGIRKLALLYVNDEYGVSMAALFKARTQAGKTPSPAVSEGYGFDVSDFKPLIAKTVASGADGVIVVGYGSQAGSLVRQLRENGFAGRIFVPSLIVNADSLVKAAGPSLQGVVFNGFDYQQDNPQTQKVLDRFAKRHPGRQSDIGILAYVGARIVLEHSKPNATPQQTIAALEAAQPFETILGKVSFSGRSFVYPLRLYEVGPQGVVPFKP